MTTVSGIFDNRDWEAEQYEVPRSCIHEAGHIVAAEVLGFPLSSASIGVREYPNALDRMSALESGNGQCVLGCRFKEVYRELLEEHAPWGDFEALAICWYAGSAADNGAPYPCVALRADLIDVRNLLLRPQPDMSVPKFFELHEALERRAAALVKDHSEAIDAISTLLNRHGMVTRADIEASLKFGRRYLSDRSLPLREGTEH